MGEVKHTPGPWDVIVGEGFAHVTADGGRIHVASCAFRTSARAAANPAVKDARLIAAAPEMLAALRDAEAALVEKPVVGDFVPIETLALRALRAAIAKATGSAS